MGKIKIKPNYKIIISAVFSVWLAFSAGSAVASEITADNIVKLVNESRRGEKSVQLTANHNLTAAAEGKAEDMIKNNYFAHTSPEGITPWDWFEKYEYDYKYAGENLAISFTDAESQHEAWMESSKHQKNILNPNYQEIGVAVKTGIIDGVRSIVVVQMFGAGEENGIVASAEINNNYISGSITPLEPTSLSQISLSGNFKETIEPKNGNIVYISAFEYENREFLKIMVQAGVMSVLAIIIFINTALLSKTAGRNPFMAANTVVMAMILTTLFFWRI